MNTIGTEKSHDYERLLQAEAEAKQAGLGVWNTVNNQTRITQYNII